MTDDRVSDVLRVCQEALAREGAARAAYLDSACGADTDLRREVEALLAEPSASGPGFLDTPPWAPPAPALVMGQRLGAYEVTGRLGAGGMGEVYKARDTRLGRTVAIKVLPAGVAADPERRRRFDQEARAVSALNHPHICTLYDIGREGDTAFLVMEYVEGQTLAHRLTEGPLPLEQALSVATEVAEALAAAHRQGVIHRDLKPGNVMLTKTGAKLLDFGLAKLKGHGEQPASGRLASTGMPSTSLTGEGMILGTLPYMAPEQVEGKPADARTDLWALGAILYEMVTGKRAFEGTSAGSLIAAILKHDPVPLSAVQPLTPPGLERLVRKCLAKDPEARWQTASDLADELCWLATGSGAFAGPAIPAEPAGGRRRMRVWMLGVAAALVIALGGLGAWLWMRATQAPASSEQATHIQVTFQRLTTFDGVETWPTLSPDGRTVAYQKSVSGKSDIYVLRVGGKNPTNLTAGLEGDHGEPAFSPDGRLIAFRSESGGGGIFVMEATGESAKRLTDFGHTPSWFPDGKRIALATAATADPSFAPPMSGLWIVDLGSGARQQIQGVRAFQPSVSPHGLRIAYWGILPGGGQRDIYTIGSGDRGAGSPIAVTNDAALDWNPFWSGDGRLLYFASDRGGTMNLWRVGIDEASGKVRGEPEPVTVPASWAGPFRATPDGSRIVFTSAERERTLERVPFDPATEKVSGPSAALARFGIRIGWPRVSPQGDLLTFPELGGHMDILILKTDGTGVRSLTDDGYHNLRSSFSPDGKKIVFLSDRTGALDLWIINVDGSGRTPITRSTTWNMGTGIWSPDGKTIAAVDMTGHPLLLPFPRSVDDPLPEPGPLPGKDLKFAPYSWSPNSKELAGFFLRTDGSYNGIVVYDVEKKTYRRATETGVLPAFLRDGRRIAFQEGNVLKIVDTANGRISEILKGDSRRTIDAFTLAPDDRSLFVSWASTQADLWLMELGGKR